MNKTYLDHGFKGNMHWASYRSNRMNSPLIGIGASRDEAIAEIKRKIVEARFAGKKV